MKVFKKYSLADLRIKLSPKVKEKLLELEKPEAGVKRPFLEKVLQSNFIEITLQHVCSPVNWLHLFRTPFPKNIYGGQLLKNYELLEIHAFPPFVSYFCLDKSTLLKNY